MIKQTVKYVNYNGVETEDTLYFHLNRVEVTKLDAKYGGDFADYAQTVGKSGELGPAIEFIEDLILSAYGKKTSDGKGFTKNPQLRSEFENSIAYAEMFERILTDPGAAQEFASGLGDVESPKAHAEKLQLLVDREAKLREENNQGGE